MNGQLPLWLGRGLVALPFVGPGGVHLLERWSERQMPASAAVALLELGAGLAVLLGWQARAALPPPSDGLLPASHQRLALHP